MKHLHFLRSLWESTPPPNPPKSSAVRIQDLPNELLLLLIEEFDVHPCTLARISRALNSRISTLKLINCLPPRGYSTADSGYISLSITVNRFHRRNYISTASDVLAPAMSSFTYDELDIFSLALDITQLDTLTCTFDLGDSFFDWDSVGVRYLQLSRSISRLTRLDKLTLVLESTNLLGMERSSWSRWWNWRCHINTLLNAAVERGVISLRVVHGSYPKFDYSFDFNFEQAEGDGFDWADLIPWKTTALSKSAIFSGKPTYEGIGWCVQSTLPYQDCRFQDAPSLKPRSYGSAPRHPQKLRLKSLTTFTISTPIFFFPPFSNWTYQLLATGRSLTTLIIHEVVLDSKAWWVAMCWLRQAVQFQKALTTFEISKCPNIILESVFYFLSGVNDFLVNLTLSFPAIYQDQKLPWARTLASKLGYKSITKPDTVFPRVVSLRTEEDILAYMVGFSSPWARSKVEFYDPVQSVLNKVKEKFPMLQEVEVGSGEVAVVHSLSG